MELAERDLKVQRLRQEKLGMLLKCFTEMSTLQDTLRSVISSTDTGSKHKQQDSKLMLDSKQAPIAIQIDDSDVEDDMIVKLTGRLEQVFESARQFKAQSSRRVSGGALEMKSGRFNTRFGLPNIMSSINEESHLL